MDMRLAFAVELEQRDETLAGRLAALADLSAEVEHVRARASELASLLEEAPAERAHLDAADAEASRSRELARSALAKAEAAAGKARGEDARLAARDTVDRAAAAARAADERQDRLAERRARLEQHAEQLGAEAADVERRAAAAAERLDGSARLSSVAPPEASLAGVVDWGARAHAAVVVARGGLESERERIVREANELASSVLREPLYTGSVAGVRRRLEQELASDA